MIRTLASFALLSTTLAVAGQSPSGYSVKAHYPIAGTSTWDYITVDAKAHRIYMSHSTQVEVLDSESGKSVGVVKGTPGVHGVALADELNRGFTSNGGDDTVTIFDLKTFAVIGTAKVGEHPDRIYYDAPSQRVFTGNHGSHDITAIDAKTGAVLGTIAVKGGAEQFVPAPGKLVYVANADLSEVTTIDPHSLSIKAHFPLGTCQEPHGLAFDEANHRLFAACRNKVLSVLDSSNGRVVATLPIGDVVDNASFDAKTKMLFASNGDGTLSVFHQQSPDKYEDMGPIQTGPNAKQMDFDPKTGRLFLPSGKLHDVGVDAKGKTMRKADEGSFQVVVVGR